MNNREAFEARMCKSSTNDLTINRFGNYRSTYVQNKWNDFQAGYEAALASQAQQDHIGEITEVVCSKMESTTQAQVVAREVRAYGRTQKIIVRDDVAQEYADRLMAGGYENVEIRDLVYALPPAPEGGDK